MPEDNDLAIGACVPSRGLVHSRFMQDVIAATLGYNVNWYFSHGNPIPDAQNILVEEALGDKNDYLFLVEDDQQLPHDILRHLLEADADIAVADYPVRGDKHCVTYANGVLQYAGLGCTLVKAEVFEKLDKPYFRTDTEYVMTKEGLTPTTAVMGNHGLLDVDWWQRCLAVPFIDVKVIKQTAGHYYLEEPKLPKWGNGTAKEYKVDTWLFST